jgi:hypothetical protein
MLSPQPTLADQFAALRAATAADAAAERAANNLLQALVLAALAALIAAIEDLVRLWQSGQLPAHTPPGPGAQVHIATMTES